MFGYVKNKVADKEDVTQKLGALIYVRLERECRDGKGQSLSIVETLLRMRKRNDFWFR